MEAILAMIAVLVLVLGMVIIASGFEMQDHAVLAIGAAVMFVAACILVFH